MKWPRFGIPRSAVYRGDWGHRRFRRWRRSILLAGLAMTLIFGLSWAVKDRLFTVKQTVVVQQVNVRPNVVPLDQVQSYARRQIGTWLWLNRHTFEKNLLAKFPSVRQVQTNIQFPDTLSVEVLPRVPLCQLVTPSGTYVADRSGFVFARLGNIDGALPQIKTDKQPTIGSTISSTGLSLGLQLITGLRSSRPALQGIDLHDGQLDVRLDGPPLILISQDAQADILLAQLKALMDKFNAEHRFPQRLDMRFERPVITY